VLNPGVNGEGGRDLAVLVGAHLKVVEVGVDAGGVAEDTRVLPLSAEEILVVKLQATVPEVAEGGFLKMSRRPFFSRFRSVSPEEIPRNSRFRRVSRKKLGGIQDLGVLLRRNGKEFPI